MIISHMKNIKNKAFTLVELLVVITILSIISVVAYQNFGWAVDKAVNGRKISDISTIETALQQYKADKNYFPAVWSSSTTNKWWYTSWTPANNSNTIQVTLDWQEVETIVSAEWGWTIIAEISWTDTQIWSKWTISQDELWKQYLTRDLYDPELWDVPVKDIDNVTAWEQWWKMIDLGIWRYVYAIYKKWTDNTSWNDYNIAYTVKKDNSDTYISKISWTYDEKSCYEDESYCPETLIGSGKWWTRTILLDWSKQTLSAWVINTKVDDYWIPYAVTDFSQ